jgi:penicillin-binding protein 1C
MKQKNDDPSKQKLLRGVQGGGFLEKSPPGRRRQIMGIMIAVVFIGVFYLLIPLPDPLFKSDYSTVVLDEDGNILRAFLNGGQQWYFPPEEGLEIPAKLKTAILMYEDRHFYKHPGVNVLSLCRAVYQYISSGEVKSGASTISMQVVRLACRGKRTLPNKLLEIMQAVKLEARYSKEEILNMYVNHAPYGGNIIGYHAASLKYFHKRPEELTWSEAATLAILPNSPGLISPLVNREKLIKKRNKLLKTLLGKKIIDRGTYRSSISEPLPGEPCSFFNHAPHLAQTLVSRYGMKSGIIRTTVIRRYQVRIEKLMADHLRYLNSIGVSNGAALVVETQTGKVRAYVGSQDFFDSDSGGQVDGIHAPRSTGSILKPFLYALAMDEGVILPQTLIRDIPSYFGSFSPANADEKYRGVVTAGEALIRSLNVPAVRLLNAYGLNKFYIFLKSAGMSTLFRSPDEYGLTLVLGGAEAALYDMAALYCGLGNYGKFRPLQIVIEKNKTSDLKELISPGACYLTLEMLKNLKRPGAEYYWDQYRDQNPIAWKTGTSYGQRDAWAVGVTPQWTIAVWVGNFGGEGNNNLSGARSAAPLMFDIFNYLPRSRENTWFKPPAKSLKKVRICLDTGFTAAPDCEKTAAALAPRGKKPLKPCPYHKRIFVTPDEKTQVCSLCWEPGKYRQIKKLVFPPDIAQYLRESGVILSELPRHRQGCPGHTAANPVRIIYPVKNAKLWIPRDFDGDLQYITFKVAHAHRERPVYWYIDDIYRGMTGDKHKMIARLNSGWHRLEVVDEQGNRDLRRFYVAVSNHRER